MSNRELFLVILFSIGIVINIFNLYKNKIKDRKYDYIILLIYIVAILNILFK